MFDLPDNLLLRPWLPVPVIAALAIGLMALAVWVYFKSWGDRPTRRALLCGMRCLAVVAIAVALLGVSWLPEAARVLERPSFTVLVDTSKSMQTSDTPAGSRLDLVLARWLTPETLQDWRAHANVQLLAFDAGPPRATTADGLRTHTATAADTTLLEAVQRVVSQQRPRDSAGLLLLSDGRDTTARPVQPVAELARQRGIAVHTVAVGSASLQRDLAVAAVAEPARLIVGEAGALNILITQSGANGQSSVLTITGPDGDRQQQAVTFTAEPMVTLTLPLQHDTPGLKAYRVALEPLAGEADPTNNTQTAYVQVSPQRLGTLLLEGQPQWDSKLLAHALRQDARIDITQLTQLADGRREAITTRPDGQASLPRTAADLAAYDVVLLGQHVERLVTPELAALITQAVQAGSLHLGVTRGVPADPASPQGQQILTALQPVLPVRWYAQPAWQEATNATLTLSGRGHPAFVDLDSQPSAPPLPTPDAIQRVMSVAPAAVVLAVADVDGSEPAPWLVTAQPGGRVLVVLARGLWQQRMRGGGAEAGLFDRFWAQLVRAAALGQDYEPGEPATLRLSHTTANLGEAVTAELLLRPGYAEQTASAELIDGQGRRTPLALTPDDARQRSVTFTPESVGDYRVVVQLPELKRNSTDESVGNDSASSTTATREAPLVVLRTDREQRNTAADPTTLRALSQATDGRVLAPDACDEVTRLLATHRATLNVPPRPRYLWARWEVLCGLLVWLGIEWVLRRRMGLW